jgi:hypothetical protein
MLKSVDLIIKLFGKYSARIAKFRYSYTHRRLGYDCWFDYLFPWSIEKAKERYMHNDME